MLIIRYGIIEEAGSVFLNYAFCIAYSVPTDSILHKNYIDIAYIQKIHSKLTGEEALEPFATW